MLLTCLLAACGGAAGNTAGPEPAFVDVTEGVGLGEIRHFAGFTEHRYLPETMGSGVGVLDADLDGWLDLYLVNSAPLEGSPAPEEPPTNHLFLRRGDGRYDDVTETAGVGDPSFGMGCAIGDVEGDGDPDIYVVNYGPNVLYRNAGEARFEDRTAAARVGDPGWSAAAGFFDADRDGDLDLYVVDYLVYSEAMQRDLFARAGTRLGAAYPHPDRFEAAPDRFHRNDGTGVFTDATEEAGFAVPLPGKGLGIAFADVEGDGDTDVYVANDSTPNFLFLDDGSGRFTEVAAEVGCAYNVDGDSEASMGVQFGDADSDGRPDLFMTHLDLETNTFYANTSRPGSGDSGSGDSGSGDSGSGDSGSGDSGFVEFRDRTRAAGVARPSFRMTGFGMAFLDHDADGHLDLFVANGDLHPNAAELRPGHSYPQPDKLLRGRGDGTFEDISLEAGPYFHEVHVSRGTAVGDLDRDGDPDLVVSTSGGPWFVLENRATGPRRWIRIELDGGEDEPPGGIGAAVRLTAGGRTQHRELWTSYGYASANEPAVFFGLGDAEPVDRVEVRWPSGAVDVWRDLPPNKRYVLERGVREVHSDP